ncbi:MAG: ADP-forming succinate--CoA ligase subunit beta [Alphaproteobacteria bacterium]|nr:ADP-forming succinate--CoA ligase subunit beta [Alphaproteobacteria bacterium]
MNVHEYQAKGVLARFDVPVPRGNVAYTVDEAVEGAEKLGGPVWVVKAQIHAGGRGKAGGVKVVRSIQDVRDAATGLLGGTLVTHQTGPEGQTVKRIYVEMGCDIARELYLSMLVDRTVGRITVVASTEGGMNIEEVADATPERITSFSIDPATGVQPHHGRRLAVAFDLVAAEARGAATLLANLYRAFMELDAELIEINPLVVTESGELLALDAKMSFDDNALFRQPGIEELRDGDEETPVERKAEALGFSYVKLDGNIGCMVNGAGLAMATMDIIKLHGEEPANVLDVGGGADKERVVSAFKIILSDPNVEAILVNIFGGIMQCDVIAAGVVEAAREVSLDVPLVVRLEGTNVDQGKRILARSGLPITAAGNLGEAAARVVAAVGEG